MVVASHDGYVFRRPLNDPGYGNYLDITENSDGSGFRTRYAHLETIVAADGPVSQGEIIGFVGTSGISGVPQYHLHYEFIENGQLIDLSDPGAPEFYKGFTSPVDRDFVDSQDPPIVSPFERTLTGFPGETVPLELRGFDWAEEVQIRVLTPGGIDVGPPKIVTTEIANDASKLFTVDLPNSPGKYILEVVEQDAVFGPQGSDTEVEVQWATSAVSGSGFTAVPLIIEVGGGEGIDRWWGTAGDPTPIDVTWTRSVQAGAYTFDIDFDGDFTLPANQQWDLVNATVSVDGGAPLDLSQLTNSVNIPEPLMDGVHTFEVSGFVAPDVPVVQGIQFQLNEFGSTTVVIQEHEARFIADHEEQFLGSPVTFPISALGITLNGIEALIDYFSPILHFSAGERYAVPFDVTVPQPHAVGELLSPLPPVPIFSAELMHGNTGSVNNDNFLDLRRWSTGTYSHTNTEITPAIYASALANRNDPSMATEIAINYYFHYPRSNWADHGGLNTHEGDWEGTTLFLNRDAPGDLWGLGEYAVSQHVRAFGGVGIQTDGLDSIQWGGLYVTQTERIDGLHPHLFVGLGGHATYLNPGQTSWNAGLHQEFHFGSGIHVASDGSKAVQEYVPSAEEVQYLPRVGYTGANNNLDWLRYPGHWGRLDTGGLGGDYGPLGPAFQAPDFGTPDGPEYGERWLIPRTWANNFIGNNGVPLPDSSPPELSLQEPFNGATIAKEILNQRGYIEIKVIDVGASGLFHESILDGEAELVLKGTGAGTGASKVEVDPIPNLIHVSQDETEFVYRYSFDGSFLVGDVSVEFRQGAVSDRSSKGNAGGRESFSVTELGGPGQDRPSLIWLNRGTGDDTFSDAEKAVVDRAIEIWDDVIVDLHNGSNTFFVNITGGEDGGIDLRTGDGLPALGATIIEPNTPGQPMTALIQIDDDGGGIDWYVDPNPENNSEFDADTPFWLSSGPAGRDMLSVVLHELTHALGFSFFYTKFDSHLSDGPGELRTYITSPGNTLPNDRATATITPLPSTHLDHTEHPMDLLIDPVANPDVNPDGFPGGVRALLSDLDAQMLMDAFGYELLVPEFDRSSGALTIDTISAVSNEILVFRVEEDLHIKVVSPDATNESIVPLSAVDSLVLEGNIGSDTLMLDNSGGLLTLPGGIHFNGGAGSDLVQLFGTTPVDTSYNPGPEIGSGIVVQTNGNDKQTLFFTGVEPVQVVGTGAGDTVTIADELAGLGFPAALNSDNAINYAEGPNTGMGIFAGLTSGLVSVDGFETIEFANFGTLEINAGPGIDHVDLNNVATPTAMALVDIDAGDGSDTVVTASGFPVDLTIDGGAGDDLLDASRLVSAATATLTGGLGDDTLIGGPGNDSITAGAGDDTIIGGGGTDAVDGGADADVILVEGTLAKDTISTTLSGAALVTVDRRGTTNYSGIATANIEKVLVEAGSGFDAITAESLGGILLEIDGGEPGASDTGDTLTFTGKGTSLDYTAGPRPGEGVFVVGTEQPVGFRNIEGFTVSNVGSLTATGTNGDDDLTVVGTGPAALDFSLNENAKLSYSGVTSLVVEGLHGDDDIDIEINDLSIATFTVRGSQPTADADTVTISGEDQAFDDPTWAPGGPESGTFTISGGQAVGLEGIERVIYDGEDDGEFLTIAGSATGNTIVHRPGLAVDSGSLQVDKRLAIEYVNLGRTGAVVGAGGDGTDLLVHLGTQASDLITAQFPADGAVEMRLVAAEGPHVPVRGTDVENVRIDALGGDDQIDLQTEVDITGVLAVFGGGPSSGSDTLNVFGTVGADAATVDLEGEQITGLGGPIAMSGIEHVNYDAGAVAAGDTLTVLGTVVDDLLNWKPTDGESGRFELEGDETDFTYANIDDAYEIDLRDGQDVFSVEATAANDVIDLFQQTPSAVVDEGYTLDLSLGQAGNRYVFDLLTIAQDATGVAPNDPTTAPSVEEVHLLAGRGNDLIRVGHADEYADGAAGNGVASQMMRFYVSGGTPNASDRLLVRDDGIGDLVLVRQAPDERSGRVTVAPAVNNMLGDVVYDQIERLDIVPHDPVTGGTGDDEGGRIVVFQPDPFELNDDRLIPTDIEDVFSQHRDPTVDPGGVTDPFGDGFDVPGDEDWYEFRSPKIGTFRFDVLFSEIAAVPSGRQGLPGDGELGIALYDADGNLIVVGTPTDDGEQVTFSAATHNFYYLRVNGDVPEAINTYDVRLVEVDLVGPQLYDPDGDGLRRPVHITDDVATPGEDESEFDLFDYKPAAGPTPLVHSITVHLRDIVSLEQLGRAPGDVYVALDALVAGEDGRYSVVGDATGQIPIESIVATNNSTASTTSTVQAGATAGSFAGLAALSNVDDFYKGYLVQFDPAGIGPLAGQTRLVGGYDGGTHTFTFVSNFSQAPVVGQPFDILPLVTATVELEFAEPLPDDRITLTIFDTLRDPAGNLLDGESNAIEPQQPPLFPTGDGLAGGDFVARFTVDSRAEMGAWAASSVYVDINGNESFDPENLDYTNRDLIFNLGFTSDDVFAGNFHDPAATGPADGFDKLAAYGWVNGGYRWLIDWTNDGVPDASIEDPKDINGLPVAGDFDGNPDNGDEVGLFDGTRWWFDTNHTYKLNKSAQVNKPGFTGYPVVGNFDNDDIEDFGTWRQDKFYLSLSTKGGGVENAKTSGIAKLTTAFEFGFIGARERPVAADMDGDGYDDLGLWVPDRSGVPPLETGDWYWLISHGKPLHQRIVTDHDTGNNTIEFTPFPFGWDIFAQFGDEHALPIAGNFDPPVGGGLGSTGVELVLVGEPTRLADQVTGEVALLPDSLAAVDEWSSFYAEVWVRAEDAAGAGVSAALVDLSFASDVFQVEDIEFGPGIDHTTVGVVQISDSGVRNLGGVMASNDMGDDGYALLARLRITPVDGGGGSPLRDDGSLRAPIDTPLRIDAATTILSGLGEVQAVLGVAPETRLWPVLYDLDGNDRIGFGDFAYFAAAFLKEVTEDYPPLVQAADFDGSGRVGFGDLAYFAANFGRRSGDSTSALAYPTHGWPGAGATALRVEAPVERPVSTPSLTAQQLDPVVDEAVSRWTAIAGPQTAARFDRVTVEITDLPADQLGRASRDRIQIDASAAGYGWFVDETPADDLEFTIVAGPSQFAAPVETAAHARVDLLTAVMHEFGHVLGWGHTEEDELMGETLFPGIRQTIDVLLAETDEAGLDAVFEQSSLSHEEVDLVFASFRP